MNDILEPVQMVSMTGRDDRTPQNLRQEQSRTTLNGVLRERPRLGCAGLIRRGDEVLMGRRNKEPNRGLWVLPGGGVEFCETFTKTLKRELQEEAGIQIDVQGVFNVFELINPPSEHRVIVYMNGLYRSGDPIPSSDLSEVRFFNTEDLKTLSRNGLISTFVETVLREANLL